MLLVKRLVTFVLLFGFLTVVFAFGGLMVAGAVVGGKAGVENQRTHQYATDYEAGQAAGREMGRKFAPTIFLSALVGAAVIAGGLSFTSVLPWCRAEPKTPPLPPGYL